MTATTTAAVATAATRARQRNPRGEGDRLREEIITAADELLAETEDADALTLRGVAKRVGIAAPSMYRHFSALDHLKQAVVDRAFARFAATRDAAGQEHTDPRQALLARCRAYCQFALDNPGPYRFMFSHQAPRTPVEQTPDGQPTPGQATFAALAESIRQCQHAGLANRAPDPAYLAAQVWPTLHGLVMLRLNAPRFPWPASLDEMITYAVSQLVGLTTNPDEA